jgi:hypothetical protein
MPSDENKKTVSSIKTKVFIGGDAPGKIEGQYSSNQPMTD